MSKRQKIATAAVIAAALVFGAMQTSLAQGLIEFVIVLLAVYGLSVWALQPGLAGLDYLTLLALPTLLAGAVMLSIEVQEIIPPWKYFIPLGFGIGTYIVLLSENIFNVSTQRLVPLLRAARTVSYLLTLAVTFVLATLIFNRSLAAAVNGAVLFLVGGAAVAQALWPVNLQQTTRRKLVLASLVSAVSVGELALVISFWPVAPLGAGLAITTLVYFLIGLIQHDWQENLTGRAVTEYLTVTLIVFLVLLFSTTWSG